MIEQVTALKPGWLQNKEKQQCFETIIKTPIQSGTLRYTNKLFTTQ